MTDPKPNFDLAIIGAGPAGSAAAITAARLGAKVALVEAGSFPRQKVCGEFISAESLDVLRDLLCDVDDAAAVLERAPVINRTRLFLAGHIIESPIWPPALSVPRFDLDRLLWIAARQAGAKTYANCEVRAAKENGSFSLDTANGPVQASAVAVAAGRWSRFRPDIPVPEGPKWIGVKAHFRELNPSLSTDLYFFDHGYCGVQPIAGDIVNACAMVRSDRAKSVEQVFVLHPALADRSRNWEPVTDPIATSPLIYRPPEPVRDNLVFLGDAAAFIDPFVGDGISIALRTGCLAGSCLAHGIETPQAVAAAIASYRLQYEKRFVPPIHAASQIRRVLSMPTIVLRTVVPLLRLPGVLPWMIHRTRHIS